jgi:hypothetical protein
MMATMNIQDNKCIYEDIMRKKYSNVKMCRLIIMAIAVLNLFGCSDKKEESTQQQEENIEYLSITETYEDYSGTMLSNVNLINLEGNGVNDTKVHTVEYASQYPLTVYDKQNDIIYYSERVYVDDDYGDQLFSYNIETKESVQLTDNIYAINYIYPVGDYIYMLGAMQNTHYLTIMKYDLNTKEFSVFDNDSKWNFDLLIYDVYGDRLYATACDAKEEEDCRESYNSRPEEEYDDNYVPPDYTIFEFGSDFYNPKQILHTENKYIRRIGATPDNRLFVTFADTLPVMNPTYESYYLDLKTDKLEDAPDIDNAAYVTEFVYFFPDGSKIYFIGADPESDTRGLCSYDTESKIVKLLYKSDVGYINNCSMLKENVVN